jgi:formate hydrogenlyase transcriptional activator
MKESVISADTSTSSYQYHTLLAVSEAIVSQRDLHELFHVLAGHLRRVVEFDCLMLILHDAATNNMQRHVLEAGDPAPFDEMASTLPVGEGPSGVVWQTQQQVSIPDLFTETRWPRFQELIRGDLRSFFYLPLTTARKRLGAVTFASQRVAAYEMADTDFLQHVANQVAVAVENALAFRCIEKLKERLEEEKGYLEEEIRTQHNFAEIVGDSLALRKVLQEVETVAPTDSTVLIRGETGTGKELIARALHRLSTRGDQPFVRINCAAIPTGLLESELFGHEKGAFTGAISQKVGRFELAHGGTLLLDEVADIPLELQPKLLRVLQEQEFERLGSTRTIRVNVRLVAATNRDLSQMVADGEFRNDLYYRLNVFPVVLPPLRDRREDIPQLVHQFTNRFARQMGRQIESVPAEAMDALMRYSWPGNVRELENVIERAVIQSTGPALNIAIADLAPTGPSPALMNGSSGTLADVERDHIVRALADSNWVLGGPRGAAARLSMKRTTLQSKIKKLGIVRSR